MSRSGRGFTLIEVLVVVTLLAMTATAGLVSVAGAGQAARLQRAIAMASELDLRARLEGRQRASSTLRSDEEQREMVLAERLSMNITAQAAWPESTRICLLDPVSNAPLDAVIFDRRGTCPDYVLEVQGAGTKRRWLISGDTGWRSSLP